MLHVKCLHPATVLEDVPVILLTHALLSCQTSIFDHISKLVISQLEIQLLQNSNQFFDSPDVECASFWDQLLEKNKLNAVFRVGKTTVKLQKM